jgi:hypothetical protein
MPLESVGPAERELRAWCEARGEEPNPAIISEMRSGEWERRQKRNMREFRRSVARWNTWRREQRREPVTQVTSHAPKPRERRSRSRSSSRTSRGDPDSDLPLNVIPLRAFRRETREQLEHRHDRELVAAYRRRLRAKAGKGYKFIAPEDVR